MLFEKLLLPPTGNVEKYIKEVLKDDLERLPNTLNLLDDWIKHQSYMPKNIERSILQSILQGCKFNLEVAKRKLSLNLYYRENMPDLFSFPKWTPEEEVKVKVCAIGVMPNLTHDGYRVSIVSLLTPKLELIDINILAKIIVSEGTLRIAREHLFLGDIYIYDCTNWRLSHVSLALHPIIRKIALTLDAVPVRIKAIYMVNAPSFIYKILGIITPLLKPKIKQKIIIDTGTEVLKNISSECVPKELGGTGMGVKELQKLWLECIQEEEEWFKNFSKYKLIGNLPKKLEECTITNDMIGVQGSFRQLTID